MPGFRPILTSKCSRVLWKGGALVLGIFRSEFTSPDFPTAGSPEQNYVLAFPRTSVWIRHEGARPFVADPTVVTFYNPGQVYRREKLDAAGDHCVWLALEPRLAREIAGDADPHLSQKESVFPFSYGPLGALACSAQRLIATYIPDTAAPDHLFVEEVLLHLAGRAVRETCRFRSGPAIPEQKAAHLSLVEEARAFLSAHYCGPLSLDQVARGAGSSVFHLCRTFRRHTGRTVHSYLTSLRLRRSLDLIPQCRWGLTDLALHLGFSSHSHFTAMFHRTFGITPSHFARLASRREADRLRGYLRGLEKS